MARDIPNWVKPWPTSAHGLQWLNILLAWIWFLFGLYGLLEYNNMLPAPLLESKIANSIPVLFFISVYANFVGHLSTAQAARAEDAQKAATE